MFSKLIVPAIVGAVSLGAGIVGTLLATRTSRAAGRAAAREALTAVEPKAELKASAA